MICQTPVLGRAGRRRKRKRKARVKGKARQMGAHQMRGNFTIDGSVDGL